MTRRQVQITGHRGAASVEPENTLRSLRYALSLGIERAEIDVHLTRDEQLIVMHDETLDRTTNGSGRVADFTLTEIKRLDAGRGEQVPTLQEVIEIFQTAWQQNVKTLLQIELKGEGVVAPTVETVRQNAIEKQIVLTSFHAERVAGARQLLPQGTFGLLTSSLSPDPLEIALRIGAGAIHLRHDLATRDWVEGVQAAGLEARVWNIDEVQRMKWAIDLGVDGIGTNDPALLLEVMSGREEIVRLEQITQ